MPCSPTNTIRSFETKRDLGSRPSSSTPIFVARCFAAAKPAVGATPAAGAAALAPRAGHDFVAVVALMTGLSAPAITSIERHI